MNWQSAMFHLGNFLLLPFFMGGFVGIVARIIFFKQHSYSLLIFAAFLGCLLGLLAGWIITGHDGHMLNYSLSLLSCAAFVLFAGTSKPSKGKQQK